MTKCYAAVLSLFLLIVFLHTAAVICVSHETNDDAFISFRFARNLSSGNGLVFNPGERVEGYTNFLWVVLIAVSYPVVNPILASKGLGLICNLILLFNFSWFLFKLHKSACLFPIIFTALNASLIIWSMRGLETSMFTMFMWLSYTSAATAARNTSARFYVYHGLLTALAVFTRPEGLLAFMFLPIMIGVRRKSCSNRRLAISACAAASLIIPYLIWKQIYFSTIIPNTFYAKTGASIPVIWRGVAYIIQGWGILESALLILTFFGLFLYKDRSLHVYRIHLALSLFVIVFIVYILAVGGDSLGPDRFLAPLIPFVSAGAFLTILQTCQKFKYSYILVAATAIGVFLALWNAAPILNFYRSPDVFSFEKEARHRGTIVGRCLAEHTSPDQSIATSIIGRIPYYSNLYTMDVFGLIDPYIARQQAPGMGTGAAGHEKSDWEYTLSRKPDFITGQELIAAPPRESDWLKRIRISLHGESPPLNVGIPRPPYPGYARIKLTCEPGSIRIWKRQMTETLQQQ
jgi:arabinofuranosyltransferase